MEPGGRGDVQRGVARRVHGIHVGSERQAETRGFEVIAVWTSIGDVSAKIHAEQPAGCRFQTTWFYALCLVAAGAGMVWVWRLHVLRIQHEMAAVLAERTRIGRELHDTLLQSLVGVGMQCDSLLRTMDGAPEAARELVLQLRRQVKFYAREARHSVWDLRSSLLDSGELETVLREVGERITRGQSVRFEFSIHGAPRPFASKRRQEHLLRIGQEAVTNAVRHAGAGTIRMTLYYGGELVTLRIADDGCGFSVGEIEATATNHWGLSSMRERAQQIGAQFHLASRPGAGTSIEVVAHLDWHVETPAVA